MFASFMDLKGFCKTGILVYVSSSVKLEFMCALLFLGWIISLINRFERFALIILLYNCILVTLRREEAELVVFNQASVIISIPDAYMMLLRIISFQNF